MCSGEEEGDDGVVDVVLAELQVVAHDRRVDDLAGLIERTKTNVVILVEVAVGEGLHAAIQIELLEPLGLLGVNHGVLGEHGEQGAVQGGEALLTGGLGLRVILLVVEVGEEHAACQVLAIVPWVAEVTSRSNQVLDEVIVDEFTSNTVHEGADGARREAMWNVGDTHVGSTNGSPIADLTLNGAALDNVTSKKGSL